VVEMLLSESELIKVQLDGMDKLPELLMET
jgi:hypothetical protein